jgi:putative tryptophan/tyrosine transport system substrate-binding protein
MDRRTFISCATCGLLVPTLGASAPVEGKVYRIGVLTLTNFGTATLGSVLAKALAARGYIVGRNITLEERSAEGRPDRLAPLAAELVNLRVDAIVAGPADAIRAVHEATTTIPIVMAFSGDDPVKNGFVASLARPGGNVTGITAQARDLAPKSMELLREAVPGLKRIAVLTNPSRAEHAEFVRMIDTERTQDVTLFAVSARGADGYAAAFAEATGERAEGMVILGDVTFTRDSAQLAQLALTRRLPAIYLFREFAVAGGLLSYGPDHLEILDLAAQYIDKILNGANPAELPVRRPTKFNLAINLKTAKTLDLKIPHFLAQLADELIDS